MELITVIVPVYNVEKYLRQCLESIVQQSYKNIEVIMVDDGSTDESGAVCEEYASSYKNFFVLHQKNAGLGMARNGGLQKAKGKYVMFLDSDDYIDPDHIEVLYTHIKEKQADVCKGGFRKVKDNGTVTFERKYSNEFFEGKDVAERFLPRLIGSAPDKKDSFEMSVWSSLYKMSYICQNGLKFPSERELISEDLVFNIEYMQYAKNVCVVSEVGYNYRINTESLTKHYQPDKFERYIKLYMYVRKRLFELHYNLDTVYRLDRIILVNIKGCIIQEKTEISGHSMKTAVKNIKNICQNQHLQKMIGEYPVHMLQFRQKVFVYMLKYQMSRCLYLCIGFMQ